jgi:NADPH:quinone reductase
MRAALYDTTGDHAGEVRIVDLPDPEPGPGEVLVRVRVSGVNPTDWKTRRSGGLTAGDFPAIVPDQDGAGDIEAVGEGVDPGRVGEPVWLYECQWQRWQGTAAEWIVVREEQAVPLPDGAGHHLGAGLGIPFMTAHRALFADGPVDGASVLVHAGAGAVGNAAIQLAVRGGARVAATVSSPEKAHLAHEAGAHLVLDYQHEDPLEALRAWAPDGVHRVVEVAPATNLALDAEVLGRGGVIASYGGPDGALEPQRGLIAKNAGLHWVLVYTMPVEAKQAAVVDITEALRAGAIHGLPEHRFALEETQAAHEAVEAGAIGKVLVDVAAPVVG